MFSQDLLNVINSSSAQFWNADAESEDILLSRDKSFYVR